MIDLQVTAEHEVTATLPEGVQWDDAKAAMTGYREYLDAYYPGVTLHVVYADGGPVITLPPAEQPTRPHPARDDDYGQGVAQ